MPEQETLQGGLYPASDRRITEDPAETTAGAAAHESERSAWEKMVELEKLHEADARMRSILDASSRAIIMFDKDFQALYCNPAACALMGFESKDSFISGFVDFVASSTPALSSRGEHFVPVSERLETAARDGFERFETEIFINEKLHFFDVELKRIEYISGFAIVVYMYDITETRVREQELMRAHDLNELQLTKLGVAMRAAKIGMWDMEIAAGDDDPVNDDRFFQWSDDFRHLLGYTDENDFPNLVGTFNHLLHPEDKDRNIEMFQRHILDKTGKTPYDIEIRVMRKGGEYAYYRASGETIRDAEGNPVRVAGALMDIAETKYLFQEAERQRAEAERQRAEAERQRTEAELQRAEAERANKAKSAFLSTMSHEIRTPMNAILGITEIQLQKETLEGSIKEALDKIYTSGDLLLGIINDILDLSKIEAGKLELVTGSYDIASLVSDTAQLSMMRVGSNEVDFELSVDENVPTNVSGDELRVKQILNNILSNAFKYTSRGFVKLAVRSEAGASDDEVILVFVVSDTGQGMTKQQIANLYDEYARFNLEANRTTEGTGLGMSITRNLLRLMNGDIAVESEPGVGSTFTVRLPQKRVESAPIGRELADNLRHFRTQSRAQMKRVRITREPMPYGRVLVVDDVETNIYVARGLLTPYELTVESAGSGFEAISKVDRGNVYDIIFMDHMMPVMDGIEATSKIRELGYTQPVVALTANAVAGQAGIFLESGFYDFISKPIDVRQLNAVLNKYIRDRKSPEVVEAARRQAKLKPHTLFDADSSSNAAIDLRAAEVFTRDATKTVAVLERFIEDDNPLDENSMKSYIIHVHGMRGALANIGMTALSDLALRLEQAGRAGNFGLVTAETPNFLSALKIFLEALTADAENAGTLVPDEADADMSYLREQLLLIRAACENFDADPADAVLLELRSKAWPHDVREMLSCFSGFLLHSEFDELIGAIDDFMKS